MTKQLKEAVKNLTSAEAAYDTAVIARHGFRKDDEELYLKLITKPWNEYLSAGGSLTMINK